MTIVLCFYTAWCGRCLHFKWCLEWAFIGLGYFLSPTLAVVLLVIHDLQRQGRYVLLDGSMVRIVLLILSVPIATVVYSGALQQCQRERRLPIGPWRRGTPF